MEILLEVPANQDRGEGVANFLLTKTGFNCYDHNDVYGC
jgi:hypothetical protein